MKLSVVTIGRNAGSGLRDTAHSVLMQSRLPDEYIVQDGASVDESVQTLVDWLRERYRWEESDCRPQTTDHRPWGETEVGGRRSEVEDRGAEDSREKAEMLKREQEPQNTQNTQNEAEKRQAKPDDESRKLEGRVCLWGRGCAVRIRSEQDAGIYDALNRGVQRARGDVIGLLHADDAYAGSNVLERVMEAFDDGAEAVYGDLQYVRLVRGDMRLVRHWRSGEYTPGQLRWGWMPPHPTLFLRRDLYDRVAIREGVHFDPTFQCAGDYDLILRVLPLLQTPPVYIPSVLVRMQSGGVSNRNVASILQKSREDWFAIRKNSIGGLHTLVSKNVRKIGQLRVAI